MQTSITADKQLIRLFIISQRRGAFNIGRVRNRNLNRLPPVGLEVIPLHALSPGSGPQNVLILDGAGYLFRFERHRACLKDRLTIDILIDPSYGYISIGQIPDVCLADLDIGDVITE